MDDTKGVRAAKAALHEVGLGDLAPNIKRGLHTPAPRFPFHYVVDPDHWYMIRQAMYLGHLAEGHDIRKHGTDANGIFTMVCFECWNIALDMSGREQYTKAEFNLMIEQDWC